MAKEGLLVLAYYSKNKANKKSWRERKREKRFCFRLIWKVCSYKMLKDNKISKDTIKSQAIQKYS